MHGFYGASALTSAFQAFESIPPEIVYGEWVQSITEEAASISATLAEEWEQRAVARARKYANSIPAPDFVQGELVLLTKPFYEKGTGYILPQCDGPYLISRIVDSHNVILEDCFTGEAYLQARPISVTRLIRFNFPPEFIDTAIDEVQTTIDPQVGSMVAVEFRQFASARPQIFVAKVERVFPANRQLEATLYQIPPSDRYGPWSRRKWAIWDTPGGPRKEVFGFDELLCTVEISSDGSLAPSSLERLAFAGVSLGTYGRDRALPARTL